MHTNGYRSPLYAILIVSALTAGGCGNDASRQPAVKAERAVEQFLNAWSRGEPPDKFADPNQPIHGTDPDWKAGHRLLSFLSAEAKESPETPNHVRCRVALSLQDKKGKKWEKEVVYDVEVGDKSGIRRASP